MGLFGDGKSKQEQIAELEGKIRRLETEVEALRTGNAELGELLRHQETDRELAMRVVEGLNAGMSQKDLGMTFCETVFRPLELASFYIALVDAEKDQIGFPTYHEGGALRTYRARKFSSEPGLTGKAIAAQAPLYVRSFEEGEALGTILSQAEKVSGLVPQSWYGVPFAHGEELNGLASFQCFQKDGFSASRRRLMDALTAILGLHLALAKR